MNSTRGEYNWPETMANTSSSLPCTFGGFNGTESTAVRLCNESLQEWLQPNLQICFTEVTSDIQSLREVSFLRSQKSQDDNSNSVTSYPIQIEITNENAQEVIENLTMSIIEAVEDDQIPINIDAITEVIVDTSVAAQLQTGDPMVSSNVCVQLQELSF